MTEKVKLDCDGCGCTSTVSYDIESNDGAAPVYCPFCGEEIIMVETYEDDDDDSWIDDGTDDEWD